jgi:hypothetical protein
MSVTVSATRVFDVWGSGCALSLVIVFLLLFVLISGPVGVYTISFSSGRRPLGGWLRRPAAILECLTLARTPLRDSR